MRPIFPRHRLRTGFLACLVMVSLWAVPVRAQDGDPVVSTANGDPITQTAFHQRVRFVRWQALNQLVKLYSATGGNLALAEDYARSLRQQLEDPATSGDAVLRQLEEERLLWQTGQELALLPTPDDVDRREAEFFSAWTGVAPEALASAPDAQAFIDAWYADASAVSGLTRDDLRAIFETEALRGLLFDYLAQRVPTEQNVIHSRHILCSFHPETPRATTPPTPEQRAAADACIAEAQARLAAGESFTTVAQALSQDRAVDPETGVDVGSAPHGGEMGWVAERYLAPAYAEAALEAPIGAVIGPVETAYGLHLIEVLGRRVEPLSEAELVADQRGYFDLWLDSLWADATIERQPGWDSGIPTEPALDTLEPDVRRALDALD